MTNDLTVNIARKYTNEVMEDFESIAAFLEAIDYPNLLNKNLIGLSLPNQPHLEGEFHVGPGAGSYTNGKKVMVGFNEFFLNQPQTRIMAFEMALRLHEVFHVYYTDFQSFVRFQQKIRQDLKDEFQGTTKESLAGQVGQFVAVGIFNGIEDGRIEFKGAFDVPGYRVVGDGFRAVWWEEQEVDTTRPELELSNFIFALVTYATMRVLPKGFYEYPKNHRVFNELRKVKNLVEYASRANTTKEFERYVNEIYQKIRGYVITLINEHTPEIQQNNVDFEGAKAQKEQGEGEQQGGNPFDNNQNQQQRSEKNQDESGQHNNGENNSSNNNEDQNAEAGLDEEKKEDGAEGEKHNAADFNEEEDLKKIKERLDKLTEKEKTDFAKEISKAFQEFRREERKYNKKDNLNQKQEKNVLAEYEANGGNAQSLLYLHPNRKDFEYSSLPTTVKREGKKLERFFQKVLESRQSSSRYNLERGRLDTRRLTSLKTGNRHIFKQDKQRSLVTTAGYILLDGSGSMHGSKYNTSIYAGSIVELGLKNLLPLKIAQFQTNWTEVIHKNVKDFEDPLKKNFLWELQNEYLQPGGGNADGISLRIAIEELKERSETDKILVVVSDGLPTDYRSVDEAIEDVRGVVRQAKKDGIKVISIFISDEYSGNQKEYEKQFRYMYGDSSVIATPETFTKEIIKVFKRFIR